MTSRSTTSSTSERARRHANRSGSAPAPEAQNAPLESRLPSVPEAGATEVDATQPQPASHPNSPAREGSPSPAGNADPDPRVADTNEASPADSTTRAPAAPPASPTPAGDAPSRPISPPARTDEFPPLPSPGVETMSHAKKRKQKGKDKAKVPSRPTHTSPVNLEISVTPFDTSNPPTCRRHNEDDANLARGIALSLGRPTDAANGASSSHYPSVRCPASPAPESPPKRQRSNTAGRAVDAGRHSPTPDPPSPRFTEYGTYDGLPPLGAFTRAPPGGGRIIMGMHYANLFCNLPESQHRIWDEQPHPKIVGFIAGGNGDRVQNALRIQTQLARLTRVPQSRILVGPPGLAAGPGQDPHPWLLSGMPIAQAQFLLDQGFFSADDGLTMYILPYVPPITPFLGTFHGLTIPEDDPQRALTILARAITEDAAIGRFVRGHRDAFPPYVSADEAFASFAESIYVVALPLRSPHGPFIAWNVYARPPTEDEEVFANLRSLVAALVINTSFSGEGRIYRALSCHICRAIDHPTNLCPYPNLPGWNGPTPETIGALEEASRAALTGRQNKFGRAGENGKGKADGKGKGKGKERDERKGGNNRRK
ncbi:hypothetical protein B0H15DRAFT_804726 [Mycena belliarum]|uniref:Uncharacterized protein n=1 Tax=Mycena belliarum TaxID=1033014 RepID=A0AAD6TYE8_9AGAR|nr:hypothetical protein B0H15DRAFT_804726 [Mycena belliae]